MPVVQHHDSAASDAVDTKALYETFGLGSSPDVPHLCYPVPDFDMELPSDARLSDLQKPRWLSNQYPFVAEMGRSMGQFSSRLNVCDKTLSIQKIDML
jgi:hypothetical protein